MEYLLIKEIFSEKDGKNKKLNIKPLMTYKGGRGNMIISGRSENQNDILYKTNIYSEIRENDKNNEENDENIINTSSKRNNNINNSFSESNQMMNIIIIKKIQMSKNFLKK